MSTALKKGREERFQAYATVSDKIKSHADDPYFVKKAEEAKETIKKFGVPDILRTHRK